MDSPNQGIGGLMGMAFVCLARNFPGASRGWIHHLFSITRATIAHAIIHNGGLALQYRK
ncbi:hypothetical protein DSO57_1024840 [Entomophthora muscae]|nr:hypothetical protein DSO57_1024840 [Entomophthora muscae]